MVITLQYSFFDYRDLVDIESTHEILDRWPHVLSGQEFIPNVGQIQREKSDKLSAKFLEDDHFFISADKILKFKELTPIDGGATYYPLYRRVKYSKSFGVTLLIAFRVKLVDEKINISRIRNLIDSILAIKVRFVLKESFEEKTYQLSRLSNSFKRNFYNYISKNFEEKIQFASVNPPFISVFTDLSVQNKNFYFRYFTHQVGASEFRVIFLSNRIGQYPYYAERYRIYVYSKLFQVASTAEGILRLILSNKISYPQKKVSTRLKQLYETINILNKYEPLVNEEIEFTNSLEKIMLRGNEVIKIKESETKTNEVLNNFMPRIKKSIKEGEIESVLSLLESFAEETEGALEIHVHLFIFRIRNLNRNYNKELISYEDLTVGINLIIYALLQFHEFD